MAETAPEMEIVESCSLCGSERQNFLFWTYDRLYRLPGKFGTLQCEQCNLIRLSPRPTVEAIGIYYPDDYGAYKKPPLTVKQLRDTNRSLGNLRNAVRDTVISGLGYETGKLAAWQTFLRSPLTKLAYKRATYGFGDLFPKFVSNGMALEVGCGTGTYLSFLKYHGWKVNGVDLSPHAAKTAKENFGIDVFLGQLENSPFPDESFDYIHLSHVVEHFFDPLETMKKVRDLLKPNGVVYIEVPNAEGIGAQMSGKYWYGWDAPRHLFMFTPDTLKKILDGAGLNLTKIRTEIWDSFSWADTYIKEDERGEKLEIRQSVRGIDYFKVKGQGISAKVKHFLKPLDGDIISCWATRTKK